MLLISIWTIISIWIWILIEILQETKRPRRHLNLLLLLLQTNEYEQRLNLSISDKAYPIEWRVVWKKDFWINSIEIIGAHLKYIYCPCTSSLHIITKYHLIVLVSIVVIWSSLLLPPWPLFCHFSLYFCLSCVEYIWWIDKWMMSAFCIYKSQNVTSNTIANSTNSATWPANRKSLTETKLLTSMTFA